jgi:hypothetical protein
LIWNLTPILYWHPHPMHGNNMRTFYESVLGRLVDLKEARKVLSPAELRQQG